MHATARHLAVTASSAGMNAWSWLLVALAVVVVVLVIYGVYKYSRRSKADVVREAEVQRSLGAQGSRGLGPHAAAQSDSWVNRETHGNMG